MAAILRTGAILRTVRDGAAPQDGSILRMGRDGQHHPGCLRTTTILKQPRDGQHPGASRGFACPLSEPIRQRYPQLLFAVPPSLHFFPQQQPQLAVARFVAEINHARRSTAAPELRADTAAANPACSPSPPV